MHQLPLLTPRPPSALSRITIALALVLGAALAWAVVAELRFQRRTTEKVSEDYLSLLARERVDAASDALRFVIAGELGSQVSGAMGSVYEELPPPAPRGAPSRSLRCGDAGDSSPAYFRYDVFPDGAHFVFLEPDHSSEMVVVANWRSVLRARMAGGETR